MTDQIRDQLDDLMSGKLSRRQVLARATALGLSVPVLGSLLAACGDDDEDQDPGAEDDDSEPDQTADEPEDESDESEDESDDEPEEDPDDESEDETDDESEDDEPAADGGLDRLIAAQGAEVRFFDPTIRPSGNDAFVMLNIYETLVHMNDEFDLEPRLATDWELIDDYTWQFNLREGVTFHNGEEFNADTLVAWFERLQNVPDLIPGMNSSGQHIDRVTSVEKVDDYTVNFVSEIVDPTLPRNLAVYFMMIPPVQPFEEDGPEALMENAVGTGPYKLVEWVKDSHLVLEANEDYWGDAPSIPELEFRPIPEDSSRASALLAGEIHIVDALPIGSIDQVNDNEGTEVRSVPAAAWIFWVQMNTIDVEEFQDVRVRQAMNYAVDADQIVETILAGHAIPSASIVNRDCFGYCEVEPYEYDPERARALLEEAGYPDGFDTKLYYSPGRYVADTEIVPAVANFLEQVGVRVELVTNEWATHLDLMRSNEIDGMQYSGKTILSIDAGYMFAELSPERPFGWMYPLQGETLEMFEEARQIVDDDERAERYCEITQRYRDEAGVIFLWQPELIFGVDSNVVWTPRGDGFIYGDTISYSG